MSFYEIRYRWPNNTDTTTTILYGDSPSAAFAEFKRRYPYLTVVSTYDIQEDRSYAATAHPHPPYTAR